MKITNEQQNSQIPLSTYRLQFNKYFTFRDAKKIIPYLKELGISHCYSSPILWAKTGSLHGYDIIDHSKINPEIGTQKEFDELVSVIKRNKMALIMDIVPNHMGLGNENKWWIDVLENGQASEYACFFDIDWQPIKKELSGKILVPVLHDHYGNILAKGDFEFNFDLENGCFKLIYYDHAFPINPSSIPIIMEHRIDILESKLGSSHNDFLEYQSIINVFNKLPKSDETAVNKIKERNREKKIAAKRLSELCKKNKKITNFIKKNISALKCNPADTKTCKRVHKLLEEQAYRLAYWRVSSDIINYRRFFDVNALIGIRTENNFVFDSTHSLILDLIEEGKIQGLRIDHPDGLLDPLKYFKMLQTEAGKRLGIDFEESKEKLLSSKTLPVYVVAEKILAGFEKIPQNWAIHGTTGYEFLNSLNNVMLDTKNAAKFSKIYNKFINKSVNFNELIIECKKLIMKTALTSELSALANSLSRITEKYYETRDYTLNGLRETLIEIISCFPVYRTYISEDEKSNKTVDYIKWAVGTAKKRSMSTDPSIYNFIEKILLCEFESDKDSPTYREILNFSLKFQQYTGPLMAKGLEDTGFFNYNRLISLNEVGGNPSVFGLSLNDFHNSNISRLNSTPHGMLTTSTHDTKYSEDVRARICSLSEIPEIWQKKTTKWSKINKSKKTRTDNFLIPQKNDEYLFYQILIGIWNDERPAREEIKTITSRIENYMLKAAREAKSNTSWININTEYENALCDFIRRVLNSPENHPFWKEFIPFQKNIALRGCINSISKIALKCTCPGVPDIYQGNELWKYNLVDPDNRNPVNFIKKQKLLNEIKPFLNKKNISDVSFLFPAESGKLKLYITAAMLNFRKKHPDLFTKGNYTALDTIGAKSEHIIAFARNYNNKTIITIVPRLISNMISESEPFPTGENIWKDTRIVLNQLYNKNSDKEKQSEYNQNHKWRDIFTGNIIYSKNEEILTGSVLELLPVSILYSDSLII